LKSIRRNVLQKVEPDPCHTSRQNKGADILTAKMMAGF
jgi:hypothetical protein